MTHSTAAKLRYFPFAGLAAVFSVGDPVTVFVDTLFVVTAAAVVVFAVGSLLAFLRG